MAVETVKTLRSCLERRNEKLPRLPGDPHGDVPTSLTDHPPTGLQKSVSRSDMAGAGAK